jgi:hypothetical protein
MNYQPKKRITFLLRNPGYFRNIEWIINHFVKNTDFLVKVIIGGSRGRNNDDPGIWAINQFAIAYPTVEFTTSYPRISLSHRASNIKRLLDYLFFLHQDFPVESPAKLRVMKNMSGLELKVANLLHRTSEGNLRRAALNQLMHKLLKEKDVSKIESYIRDLDTEYLAILPAVADETSLLIAAGAKKTSVQSIGIVASWDNLTIKGQFIDVYDRSLFWSHGQISELNKFHLISPDSTRHAAYGCYPFAHRNTEKVIEEQIGLNTLTWFMSSGFIGTNKRDLRHRGEMSSLSELDLIFEFMREILKRKTFFDSWKVVIRAHPQLAEKPEQLNFLLDFLKDNDLSEFVTLDLSGEPVGDNKRRQYTDLLQKTDVGVGLVTTALFELALMKRNVIAPPGSLADRSFKQLVHGSYLLSQNGGPVYKTETWEEFFSKLEARKAYSPTGQFEDMTLPKCDTSTFVNIEKFILQKNTVKYPHYEKAPKVQTLMVIWEILGSFTFFYHQIRKLRLRILFKTKKIFGKKIKRMTKKIIHFFTFMPTKK